MPISKKQEIRLLVTGGAGFIGFNYLLDRLRNYQDAVVVNLDKLTYASNKAHLHLLSDYHNYVFHQGDICNADLVNTLIQKYQINTIVHFAAESHVDRSIAEPDLFIQSNIVGTFTLLECARKYWLDLAKFTKDDCRFHHVSTDEVYGSLKHDDPKFTENSPYNPSSPYSASKASSDHWVTAYHRTYGLPITMSHCTNNYGPYQHTEKLIPKVIQHCMQNTVIPLYGDGSAIRDWLYVGDHCDAINCILEKGLNGEKYNIAGDCEVNNLEMIRNICAVMRMEERLERVADRAGHDWRYGLDTGKIFNELGWKARIGLFDGLERTALFYLNQFSTEKKHLYYKTKTMSQP